MLIQTFASSFIKPQVFEQQQNQLYRTIVIQVLTVQQILLKRSISSKGYHQFLMDII